MSMRTPLSLDTVVTQAKELVTSELDGEVVMMSVELGKYFALNDVGSQIWPLIATPRSIRAVCDHLLPQFDVERAQGEREVLAFFEAMLEKRVITVVDSPVGTAGDG